MSDTLDVLLTVAWHVAIIGALTFLSQVFTGLNIGLMSLDTAQLQVLIDVPNKDEAAVQAAKHARKILPLRRRGNLLLCTILLGNTAVNALMAVFLGGVAGGLLGWLITTVIIVLFCEILPQSVCTRHGLFLGAMGAPIINVAMCLFYPITKPYALVLDYLFPQRENMLDRSQLRALVEYQKAAVPGMLAQGQAEMLIGALGFGERTVGEVMVPLERAFQVQLSSTLDYELAASVVQEGFSRFPVIDAETGQVEGILHCKDLLKLRFLDPSADPALFDNSANEAGRPRRAQTAGDLLQALRAMGQERQAFVCGRHTTLMALLSEFKRRPHLAVVAETESQGEVESSARHVGIVTLHDVFQMILQANGGFTEQGMEESSRRAHRQAGTVRLFDRQSLGAMAEEAEPLGENEAEAVLSFLTSTGAAAFSPELISSEELLELLRELRPIRPAKRAELYRRSEKACHGTLVLQGAVRIVSGEEAFESTMGPWSCMGMQALEPAVIPPELLGGTQGAEVPKLREQEYISDFTATVLTEGCLVLQIDQKRYLQAHLKSKGQRV